MQAIVKVFVLETGSKLTVKLNHGIYTFRVKLVDLPNEFVEVYKCVNQCESLIYDITDQYGLYQFKDEVSGLSTIVYKFKVKGKIFAELHVIPVVIDANEIIKKTFSLIETLIFAKRISI